ncbi:unnamed protein product [Anisakis simplex]|uniref:MFS domain-containing protein n=1 Tax=Anisakis simplex TaxID=6269 RepID=A0A0M3K951_ANISI|nr:unnamed protein product [Anisakis simplex]
MMVERKRAQPLFHYRQIRLYIGLLLMLAFFCTVSMRTNLGMAMVCMVNATAYSPSITQLNRSLESDSTKSVCPNREAVFGENATALSEAGYKGSLLWSPSMQSALYSATFYGGFITIFFSGYLADRYGPKYMLLLAMLDYIVVTLFTPLLAEFNYYAFFVARVIMGLGEGIMVPAMASVAGIWFPPFERSTMAAIYTSGNQLAGTFGVLISSRLCEVEQLGGWYSIFYIFAILGLFSAGLWFVVSSNSPNTNRWISEDEKAYLNHEMAYLVAKKKIRSKVPWVALFTAPCVLASFLSQFSYNFLQTMMQSYLPTYFKDAIMVDLRSNGLYTALPFFCQLVFKNLLAVLSDRLKKAHLIHPTTACKIFQTIFTFGSAVSLISLALFVDCTKPTLAVVLLALTASCMASSTPGFLTSLLCIAPKYSGTMVSCSMVLGTLANIAAPNIIGGFILKTGSPEEWAVVFYVCAGICIFAGIVFLIFGSSVEQEWAKSSVAPVAEKRVQNVAVEEGCGQLDTVKV